LDVVKLRAIPTMLSMVPTLWRGTEVKDIETIEMIVREAFPGASQISTATLAEWMETSRPLVLVDVRSPEEFAVSHLRGAINVRSASQIAEAARARPEATAILYCSVGFRSSRLTELLAKEGVAQVMNLEGSIFQWANEGRELFRGDVRVSTVHPFGGRWTGLLKPGLGSEV
jgi:rhodanese-related sulfurtransferase